MTSQAGDAIRNGYSTALNMTTSLIASAPSWSSIFDRVSCYLPRHAVMVANVSKDMPQQLWEKVSTYCSERPI